MHVTANYIYKTAKNGTGEHMLSPKS